MKWFLSLLLFLFILVPCYGYTAEEIDSALQVLTTETPPLIQDSLIYAYNEVGDLHITREIGWVEIEVTVLDPSKHEELLSKTLPANQPLFGQSARVFVKQPVYFSLTSISKRFHKITPMVVSLLTARVVPDKIFMVLSKEGYLFDKGIQHLPDELLCLVAAGHLKIIFSPNNGPHRKLLPVLRHYWNHDVFIATVDDDIEQTFGQNVLYHLLSSYVKGGRPRAVVSLRNRRLTVCDKDPFQLQPYNSFQIFKEYYTQAMLELPTGTGGVLYKPEYFHKTVFREDLRLATGTADDFMFRLVAMMNDVPVLSGCCSHDTAIVVDDFDREYDRLLLEFSSTQAIYDALNAFMDAHPPPTPFKPGARPEQRYSQHRSTGKLPLVAPAASAQPSESGDKVRSLGNLYQVNLNGGNDVALAKAAHLLNITTGFSLQQIITDYIHERDPSCFSEELTDQQLHKCAMRRCTPPSPPSVTIENTSN